MTTASLSSRITESATRLAKGFISAPTDGHTAYETTNDLTALRDTHKLSSAPSRGTSSPPRLPKPLSGRHRGTLGLRNSKYSPDLSSESELEDEFSGFLSRQWNIGEASSSSSRSGSTMDLTVENQDDSMRWDSDAFHRHDILESELSRSKKSSHGSRSLSEERNGHFEPGVETFHDSSYHYHQCSKDGQEVSPYGFTFGTTQGRHRASSFMDLGEVAKGIQDDGMALRKQKALSRLQLIVSHMPTISQAEHAAAKQLINLDTSHNQLCLGEEAQEWAEFEALMLREGNMQAMGQDAMHVQRNEQTLAADMLRQGPMQSNLHQSRIMHHVDRKIETASHEEYQHQILKKDQERSRDKAPMVEFHCPWVDCHRRFQICTDYARDTTTVDSLPCVHVGCELNFDSEEVWREHISNAHHGLLPKLQPTMDTDMEGVWEKVQA